MFINDINSTLQPVCFPASTSRRREHNARIYCLPQYYLLRLLVLIKESGTVAEWNEEMVITNRQIVHLEANSCFLFVLFVTL